MKNIFFLLCLIFLIHSCILEDSIDKRDIRFINKSKRTVYCLRSRTDSFKNPYSMLDEVAMNELYKVLKDSLILSYDKPSNWDNYIKNSLDGKLRIFIIPKDSIDKYGWKKIFDLNIYSKVYKFNIEDLNKIKWTITYCDK